jgi:hypothetical protein
MGVSCFRQPSGNPLPMGPTPSPEEPQCHGRWAGSGLSLVCFWLCKFRKTFGNERYPCQEHKPDYGLTQQTVDIV